MDKFKNLKSSKRLEFRSPCSQHVSELSDSWTHLGPSCTLQGRFWALLATLGALLGRSWVAPGPSWAAPGGHFGLPGVTFSRFLGGFFGGLARGLEKTMVSLFLWCFLCAVLVLFLSLSCLPRGAPGRHANIEQFIKNSVFYNEFAGVPFLRQVQREQISEHRRTQNCKKNTCRNSPRDV